MNELNNEDKLQLVLKDLAQWNDNGESDCSMSYAFRNGYDLHAANLWLSTGALSEGLSDKIQGLTIDPKKEKLEIEQICNEAYIYICPDCNHHAFLDDGIGKTIDCQSCLKEAILKEGE